MIKKIYKEGILLNGVSKKGLPHFYVQYIRKNHQFRKVKEDKSKLILLRRNHFLMKHGPKIYKCPYTQELTSLKQIKVNSQFIDWNCANCNKPIKAKIGKFGKKNLLCPKCIKQYGYYHSIPEHVVKKSTEFRNHCKSLVIDNHKKIRKWIKKS